MEAGFARKLDDAWSALSPQHGRTPSIGIILGSGLGGLAAKAGGVEIPYPSIPGFPRATVAGHAGLLKLGRSVAVMAGRFHYYEGHPIDDVVLPVFLLHRFGVRTLIVTNAAGGVNTHYAPGDLVLIKDHVNFMGVNPLRGANLDLGPRFPDMSEAYDPKLRSLAHKASAVPLEEGVYGAFAGPSYETPAEIRMLAAVGVDLVGMSTVPEVIAASYLGIRVLGISCVTNMAAGILPQPLDHAEVMARGKEAAPRFIALLEETISRLGGSLGES
jgi:purine-nucleoside phosphorylase